MSLFYIRGNHDFDLTSEEVEKVIPGIQVVKYYRSGRIHAEHGQNYDLFNKPDYRTDPAFGRPIAYFISRLLTSIHGSGYGIMDLPTYLDDILEAVFTSQTIFGSIIEGLAERAGFSDDDEFKMPGKNLKIGEVKARYDKFSETYSVGEILKNTYQTKYLNGTADYLCHKNDFNVVVFGHTHKAMLDKDFFLTQDRIYANAGSWCNKKAHFVEIDKNPIKVSLYNEELKKVKEEVI